MFYVGGRGVPSLKGRPGQDPLPSHLTDPHPDPDGGSGRLRRLRWHGTHFVATMGQTVNGILDEARTKGGGPLSLNVTVFFFHFLVMLEDGTVNLCELKLQLALTINALTICGTEGEARHGIAGLQ